MALPIEGTTVIVRLERMQPLLDAGAVTPPNATSAHDDHLWWCSFMDPREAEAYLALLATKGLNTTEGPQSDAVLISERDLTFTPYCEWIAVAQWDRAHIAWLAGTEPTSVVAREGWDPSVGSRLIHRSPEEMDAYERVGEEKGVIVYRHKETGEKIYLGRSVPLPEERFGRATAAIREHWIDVGQRCLEGEPAAAVEAAVAELADLAAMYPDWWQVAWFQGKGLQALGRDEDAVHALRRADTASGGEEAAVRELAGACLMASRFDEAVDAARRALTLEPGSPELLGNLAVAQLLAGDVPAAGKAIDAALQRDGDDPVNAKLARLIRGVASGELARPDTLAAAMGPPRRADGSSTSSDAKPWWKFW